MAKSEEEVPNCFVPTQPYSKDSSDSGNSDDSSLAQANIITDKMRHKLKMVSFFKNPLKKRIGYVRIIVIRTEIFTPRKYEKIILENLEKHYEDYEILLLNLTYRVVPRFSQI